MTETWAAVRVPVGGKYFWQLGHAPLCPPCREAWWAPFQLPLWPDEDQVVDELPAEAPLWRDRPATAASWPVSSTRAWRDRRLSVLVGSAG